MLFISTQYSTKEKKQKHFEQIVMVKSVFVDVGKKRNKPETTKYD